MQTNMSPLTWMTTLLNRSLMVLLYSKKQTPHWNTVSMYIELFRRNNVKQNRLEKQNIKKENSKC